ncbi:hypothetical protein [Pseudomonas sp. DC1.2]|nr:hypothetical protein [Pseudomonas sp. DC1.2]MEB0044287.1 hypothetical protein [Pseudomonas sp. Dout3]MEB0094776.1 hypothetical protein [Pseudomonas sp. DC1.2]WPX59858.1 hypothetical protein RHM68_04230 [Pseudomonas sp. DC1.2]
MLLIFSFGLFFYYWSFKNWSLYKRETQTDIWPWARGFFYIFFIHKLYRRADEKIRHSGLTQKWDFEQWATVFVVLTVVVNLLSTLTTRVNGFGFLAGWVLLILPLRAWVLSKSQPMLNAASNDPLGLSNSRFTAWNYLFMVPGLLLWAMTLIGFWARHR